MAARGMRKPRAAQANIESALTEQLWQLGDVARDAPRFIFSIAFVGVIVHISQARQN
jgi:hypothetical protein